MSNDVSVTIDVANQTITSSDPENVTVPTNYFDIVTFDGKSCIRANQDDGPYWPIFYFGENIKSFSCKIFLQSVNGFTFFAGGDTNSTQYGLVYNPHGYWHNPDRATFDPNNNLVGTWVTVTYSNTDKTLTFDNGTTQFTRTIDGYLINFYIACFDNRYNVYLTDFSAETSTRYINKPGLAEIWANIKNYITAQLLGKSNTGHTHTKSEITDFPTIPTKTSDLTNDSGFLTSHQDLSGYVPRSGGAVISGENIGRDVNNSKLNIWGGSTMTSGGRIILYGSDYTTASDKGRITLQAFDGSENSLLTLYPSGTFTYQYNNTIKHVAMQEDVVPRSGGAVMTGDLLASSTTHSLGFGYGWGNGGTIYTYSPTHKTTDWQGTIRLEPLKTTSNFKTMQLAPGGTWTWNGTACQITSDQRYKQQITEIDDKLLDAWEDVELVQFKYNESVDTKGKSARLHTGYVVQQINKACTSHGVDITQYGLFCHEEYPKEIKEIEVIQKDGTKTKETKVIREANEHYSLRYTEALIVECKYLRRCIARLTARIEELEKGNNTK